MQTETTNEIGQALTLPSWRANDLVYMLNRTDLPTGPKAKRWRRLKNGRGCSVGCIDGEGKLRLVSK